MSASLTLTGTAENDVLAGGSTNDTIYGLGGHDELYGNSGRDTLVGGEGYDSLYGGQGNDKILGGGGDDYLDGGQGADTLRGGAGNDTYRIDNVGDRIIEVGNSWDHVNSSISYVMEAGVDSLNLNGGDLDGTGNDLSNNISGTDGNNRLIGGAGDDSLSAGNGDNYLDGGDGDDYLTAGRGTSVMVGGAGNDGYDVYDCNLSVYEAAGEGEDYVYIYNNRPGDYTITLEGEIEYIWFAGVAMTVVATDTDNYIMAGGGDDIQLYGMGGNDYIESYQGGYIDGGDGDDEIHIYVYGPDIQLHGGNGNDVLHGNGSVQLMSGGSGSDTFWLSSYQDIVPTITDFSANDDLISFDGVDHNSDGYLDASHFYSAAGAGAVAQDEDDYLIFDTASGALYFDYDGTGSEYEQYLVAMVTITDGQLSAQNFYNEWYAG